MTSKKNTPSCCSSKSDGGLGGGASALTVEYRPIGDLRPYSENPRRNDAAVDAVANSIREFGFRQPIVVDEDWVIIAGHTRYKAAQMLGIAEVPVHVATGLTAAQVAAYRLADNKTAELAEWDDSLLEAEIRRLQAFEFDLDLLAFSDDELAKLLGEDEPADGLTDPDDVPELPGEPITQPGDLWLLGEHRLLCGDATNADHVTKLLDGRTPFIMVTDPPYGVDYDPTYRSNNRTGLVNNDDRADWVEAYRLFPGAVAYVWHGNLHVVTVASDLLDLDYKLRAYILWKKPHFAMGRGHYHWQHEVCWYAAKGTAKWCGDRTQSTVWEIDHVHPSLGTTDDGETVHSTQKPIECMRRPIANHGGADDDVYDPFLGSGTTIIAAEQLGRRCYGLEIDPRYCDTIVERWQRFTGMQAERLTNIAAAVN